MLERVPLLEKQLDDYEEVVEPGTIERIRDLANQLHGARILHINATAYGGGVAELLATNVPLMRDAGLEAEWQVIHGSDEFFGVTKTVHNALQGADIEWNTQMERIYLERVLDNALQLDGERANAVEDRSGVWHVVVATATALRDDPDAALAVPGVTFGTRLMALGAPFDGWLPVAVPGRFEPAWAIEDDVAAVPPSPPPGRARCR